MNIYNDPSIQSAKRLVERVQKQLEPTYKALEKVNAQLDPVKASINAIKEISHATQIAHQSSYINAQKQIENISSIISSIPQVNEYYKEIYSNLDDNNELVSPENFNVSARELIDDLSALSAKQNFSNDERQDILQIATILTSDETNDTLNTSDNDFDESQESECKDNILCSLKELLEQYAPSLLDSDFYFSEMASIIMAYVADLFIRAISENQNPIYPLVTIVSLISFFKYKRNH
ncbi:hypothetical protein IGI39_004044 [Enterococcus sp. AZ135]|uniref:hypothetical protein n=1 Tax=unclassified Enterococcus TaxID=2608891 RepID=UPI003F20FC82